MILLDTHAFLWFVGSPESLSPAALKMIESFISKGKPVLVSSISIWEICVLASRGRLELAGGIEP
jgi:PIN domain nuclease of toxin-antitoxin system